jgi:hypothetical protein
MCYVLQQKNTKKAIKPHPLRIKIGNIDPKSLEKGQKRASLIPKKYLKSKF